PRLVCNSLVFEFIGGEHGELELNLRHGSNRLQSRPLSSNGLMLLEGDATPEHPPTQAGARADTGAPCGAGRRRRGRSAATGRRFGIRPRPRSRSRPRFPAPVAVAVAV